MGYDFVLCKFKINGEEGTQVYTAANVYMSYNWTSFTRKCIEHGFHCCNQECERENFWHILDCDKKRANQVADELQEALTQLESEGILPSEYPEGRCGWTYGLNENDEPLPHEERLGIFAYHLNRIMELANENSQCFFLSEYSEPGSTFTLCDGTQFTWIK